MKICYCNKCGKEITGICAPVFKVQQQLPYGSKHDGDFLAFDLCVNCMDEWVEHMSDGFVHSPIVNYAQIE